MTDERLLDHLQTRVSISFSVKEWLILLGLCALAAERGLAVEEKEMAAKIYRSIKPVLWPKE